MHNDARAGVGCDCNSCCECHTLSFNGTCTWRHWNTWRHWKCRCSQPCGNKPGKQTTTWPSPLVPEQPTASPARCARRHSTSVLRRQDGPRRRHSRAAGRVRYRRAQWDSGVSACRKVSQCAHKRAELLREKQVGCDVFLCVSDGQRAASMGDWRTLACKRTRSRAVPSDVHRQPELLFRVGAPSYPHLSSLGHT